MKKIITIFLFLLLAIATISTVAFAESTEFTISSRSDPLYRGDTVSLVFGVDGIKAGKAATSYGLKLSYDTDIFELVEGSCTVPNTLVSSFNNGFAFMFQTPKVYDGIVGTVKLKIKDNAPFGTYTITGTPSVKNGSTPIEATCETVTLTIACKHSFGSWSESGTGHKRICSICQQEHSESHTWDRGTVLKQADCTEGGQTKYTCTTCYATKTEDTGLADHKYGYYETVNSTEHKRICSVCSYVETTNHMWSSGTVTKPASCKENGTTTHTCIICHTTKKEPIPQLTTHTYDHACDTTCNVCSTTRTITHSYKTEWSKDKANHWHECSVCKDKKDLTAHTPGPEATEKQAQTCTTCGYIIKPALGHKHSYATVWTTDDAGHWYACSGCEEQGSYADHDFENPCDTDCSICGFTRQTRHSYEEAWKSDKEQHYHVCTGCGEKADAAAHEPGPAATETTPQTCTICDYELAPATGTSQTEPTTPTQPTEPADEEDGFPWVIVLVAIVAIGGVAAGVVLWKKKH